MISVNLSWSYHYQSITAKAYKILGLICRKFANSHNANAKLKLYITLVRSQLTYCSQVWHPYLLKDMRESNAEQPNTFYRITQVTTRLD